MSKLPLVDGVKKYLKEDMTSFCMPGHKGGKGFNTDIKGKSFFNEIFKADLTEVDGLDNLHKPEGIIKEAQEQLSRYYKSKKSYFLVNGSTSGNLAMIFSCFNEGDKVIVERNCHRSIFNGIILRKLRPVYIKNKINSKYNAPMSIDMEHFLCQIKEHSDAKGIIITYPNYYGICSNLGFIVKEAGKYNMKVLIDSAHGAHFGVCEGLPENALSLGADMVVMSSHKTLASFTQTAYLHVGIKSNVDIEKVSFYVSSFLSTSPSYMLMCSMDYGRYFLEEYGRQAYGELLERASIYRSLINKLNWLHILDEHDMDSDMLYGRRNMNIDLSRFVINLKQGYSSHKLYDYLLKNKIQAELSDNSNVVLIFSTFNNEEDFLKLYEVLSRCNVDNLKEEVFLLKEVYIPTIKYLPWQAFEMKKKKISLEASLGEVCGNEVVPYPPGVPILNIGEIIDETSIDMVKYYMRNNITMLGIEADKITIVEN